MQTQKEVYAYMVQTTRDANGRPEINDDAAAAIRSMVMDICHAQREPLLRMTAELANDYGLPDSAHEAIWTAFIAGLECAVTGMALGRVRVEHINAD